jgi:mono/diheme cytochrome c family protein
MEKSLPLSRRSVLALAHLAAHVLTLGLIILSALAALPSPASAQSGPEGDPSRGQALFGQKCGSCHTIGGGKLVGPDLAGVTDRRDPAWVTRFILTPDRLIADGDPLAMQLLEENNFISMPNLGLSEVEAGDLLAYLANPGAVVASGQVPGAVEPVALPSGSALAGQKLFRGETRLQNGGAPCLACHTVSGNGLLEGGSLGPDLTHVMQRYGEAGLAANLNQITFPTMLGPFQNRPLTPQEQADLIAYFAWSDTQAPVLRLSPLLIFLAAASGGTLLLFALLLAFWPRQRQSLAERLRRQAAL